MNTSPDEWGPTPEALTAVNQPLRAMACASPKPAVTLGGKGSVPVLENPLTPPPFGERTYTRPFDPKVDRTLVPSGETLTAAPGPDETSAEFCDDRRGVGVG